MKITRILVMALIVSLCGAGFALADGPSGGANKGTKTDGVITKVIGEPEPVTALTVAPSVKTADFEAQMDAVREKLNALSAEVAKLAFQAQQTDMKGDRANFQRTLSVFDNVSANVLKVADQFSKSNPEIAKQTDDIRAKLAKLYAYSFGPDRPTSVNISQVSNEGKGEIIVGERTIRYIVTPGLKATIQDEREVIAAERLPDGSYKLAKGILYSGQEDTKIVWDERTFSRIDWELDHHNACADQKAFLACGDSQCVPYSENKTVNQKKK